MKKAYLWKPKPDNKTQCYLCSHYCLLEDGEKGICGVRQNQDGKLYSLNYAKAIAANIDPIEKKPLYHFLPGSKIFSIAAAGCNFRCDFCQNWRSSQITKGETGRIVGEDFPPEEVVAEARKYDCPSIAYTYTEPTIFFEYAADSAELAQEKGIKNVFVSNGFQTDKTIDKMEGLIDAANIDLKAFSDDYYQNICGARLKPVLDSIKSMHERGIWVEVTTLIVPEANDDPDELKELAEFLVNISPDIPWHISRFTPQYKMSDSYPTPKETLLQAAEIGEEAGLNYIYVGNIHLEKYSHTYCPECGEKVIDRSGYRGKSKLKDGHCPECNTKIPGVF